MNPLLIPSTEADGFFSAVCVLTFLNLFTVTEADIILWLMLLETHLADRTNDLTILKMDHSLHRFPKKHPEQQYLVPHKPHI